MTRVKGFQLYAITSESSISYVVGALDPLITIFCKLTFNLAETNGFNLTATQGAVHTVIVKSYFT